MKYLRYYSNFKDVNNISYRVEILQEADSAFNTTEVTLSNAALKIGWKGMDKYDTVNTSAATLTLDSEIDRQFTDLYHVRVGDIRLDVYRLGELYWSGIMDTELYEEPFSYKKNYDVALTFSDFSILERLKWNTFYFASLRKVLNTCLNTIGINNNGIKEYISTSRAGATSLELLDNDSILCDNFFDEDGHPLSMREVLEGILKPYDLHIMQKGGKIHIWDWNALSDLDVVPIIWDSDDAVFGVDKVFNDIKIAFSPYEKTDLIAAQVKKESIPSENGITVHTNGSTSYPEGFKIYINSIGKGLLIDSKARFFKIESIYSGQNCAGVAWTVECVVNGSYQNFVKEPTKDIGSLLFTVPDKPYVLPSDNHLLKLNMELLADVRYNPFETAGLENEEGNWDRLKNWCNITYIPFILNLLDSRGNAIAHYQNIEVRNANSYTGKKGWQAGSGKFGKAWLCYYDKNDRRSSSGIGGFQMNKQCIGYYQDDLPAIFNTMQDGEYIPLPPEAGRLELKIGAGILFWDYKKDPLDGSTGKNIYSKLHWLLYKSPKITLTDKYGNNLDSKDVELEAWINKDAKEELQVDTILGTLETASPVARGQIFSSDKHQIQNVYSRANKTGRLEELLTGTIYSHYACRHNKLSGSVELLTNFGVYADNNEQGKFAVLTEMQDIVNSVSEVEMVAINADSYDGIEYKEEY